MRIPRAFAIRIASSSERAAEKSNASRNVCFFRTRGFSFLEDLEELRACLCVCVCVCLGREK